MFCPCYHEESLGSGMASTNSQARKQKIVKTLVQLSSDKLLERVVPPKSWAEVGNEFSLEVFCQNEILVQVQKFWLGQVPSTLAVQMLRDAMIRYDNQQGVCILIHIHTLHMTTVQVFRDC